MLPPVSRSYWVAPHRLLAGAYPGAEDAVAHEERLQALINAGIRAFVNLMEPGETNYQGKPFTPYEEFVLAGNPRAIVGRFAIKDNDIPSAEQMKAILNFIDSCLDAGAPVYVHCWGGLGRTGTTVACWLLRHQLASHSDVFSKLTELRKADRESGHRDSPQTSEQNAFVQAWSEQKTDHLADDFDKVDHWSTSRNLPALLSSSYVSIDDNSLVLDKWAVDANDRISYELMRAMVSVWECEGWEGFKGAPRVMKALLARLSKLPPAANRDE